VEAREAVDRLVRSIRGESDISHVTIRIQSVFPENIPTEI
jgi:LacI family transcriptional regulator